MKLPDMMKQVAIASGRSDLNFHREAMRSLLCRACTLSLRSVKSVIQSRSAAWPFNDFRMAVEACAKLHFLVETDNAPNCSSARFASEILLIALRGGGLPDATAADILASPRRQKLSSTVVSGSIDCVHSFCEHISSECTMCLRVCDDVMELKCDHRLCDNCVKAADSVRDETIAATPFRPLAYSALDHSSAVLVKCPVCDKGVGKAAADVPRRRMPTPFASMVRLKALKRETEFINCIVSAAAATSPSSGVFVAASVIRQRIQTLVDGGKDDLFNHRSQFGMLLFEHSLPELVALLSACCDAHKSAQSPNVYFVSDSTVRSILMYVNSPAIAVRHAGSSSKCPISPHMPLE